MCVRAVTALALGMPKAVKMMLPAEIKWIIINLWSPQQSDDGSPGYERTTNLVFLPYAGAEEVRYDVGLSISTKHTHRTVQKHTGCLQCSERKMCSLSGYGIGLPIGR